MQTVESYLFSRLSAQYHVYDQKEVQLVCRTCKKVVGCLTNTELHIPMWRTKLVLDRIWNAHKLFDACTEHEKRTTMNKPVTVELALPKPEAMQLCDNNWHDVVSWLRSHNIECGISKDIRYLWVRSSQTDCLSLYNGYWLVCTPVAGSYGIYYKVDWYSSTATFSKVYKPLQPIAS